jgi:Sodium/hydrogen exchanger family
MINPKVFLIFADAAIQPSGGSSERMVAIFITEIVLMLFLGRLLGELMQRVGQPAVMGQLIAGILVGPSVFGALLPSVYQTVFPDIVAQQKMIDAIAQLGILMLLLLTGMETDLKLVSKMRRTAFFTSIFGILFPFACGYALGEFLPDSMIPQPSQRLTTVLEFGEPKSADTIAAPQKAADVVKASFEVGVRTPSESVEESPLENKPTLIVNDLNINEFSEGVLNEVKKGYDMIFIGLDGALENRYFESDGNQGPIANVLHGFVGVSAIAIAKGTSPETLL